MFSTKKLGVIIDSELVFEEHISTKVRVANGIVGLIHRSFTHLDCKSFTKMYTAFVRPHLEYAQSVWAPHSRKHINMLKNVQKLANGLGNMDYPERLKRLNLPTLVYRRLRGDVIEIYKHFNIVPATGVHHQKTQFSDPHSKAKRWDTRNSIEFLLLQITQYMERLAKSSC